QGRGAGERLVRGLAVVVPGPGVHPFAVERDQRRDVRAAVANPQAGTDERVGPEPPLEQSGGDVLATGGHEDLLGATGDAQESLVVDLPEVAGAQPAVLGHGLGGCVRVVPVAAHDLTTGDEDLAVVGDPDRGPGERAADGADAEVPRDVHRHGAAALGQPVALQDRYADPAVEVGELLSERGAAGHREAAAAPE